MIVITTSYGLVPRRCWSINSAKVDLSFPVSLCLFFQSSLTLGSVGVCKLAVNIGKANVPALNKDLAFVSPMLNYIQRYLWNHKRRPDIPNPGETRWRLVVRARGDNWSSKSHKRIASHGRFFTSEIWSSLAQLLLNYRNQILK